MTPSPARAPRRHPPLMALATAMAVLALVCLAGLAVDDRTVLGVNAWLKPLKFAISFGVYAVTVAWLVSHLTRFRRTAWWAGTVMAVFGGLEVALITGQAARGHQSHFNNRTDLDAGIFAAMGGTIAVFYMAALVVAVLLMVQPIGDAAVTWTVRLGLLIALAGMGLGFLMIMPTADQRASDTGDVIGAHSVGVTDGGPGMALTGWSTTGGDLRIPHFVGMHALQVLPLLAIVLAALAGRFPRLRDVTVRLHLVLVAAGAYVAVLTLVTWQALRGQALIHPDATTLAAAGLIAVVTTVTTVVVLGRRELPAVVG